MKRRHDTDSLGLSLSKLRRVFLFTLSSFLLSLVSCGSRDSYYIDSELTDRSINHLNLFVEDKESYFFRISKPQIALYKANVDLDEWIPFSAESEVIELECAQPGKYSVRLQIGKLKDLENDLSLNTSNNIDILVDETVHWEFTATIAEDDNLGDGPFEENEDGEKTHKDGEEKDPKNGEDIEIPTEKDEEDKFENGFWSLERKYKFKVHEKELVKDKSKKYELIIYGGIEGDKIDKWIDFKQGMEIDLELNFGDNKTKWIWIKYRDAETKKVLKDLTKATPVLLKPKLEIFGAGKSFLVRAPPFYPGIVSGISLEGCSEDFEFTEYDLEGYYCTATNGYAGLKMTILFDDGRSIDLQHDN